MYLFLVSSLWLLESTLPFRPHCIYCNFKNYLGTQVLLSSQGNEPHRWKATWEQEDK